MKTTKQDKKGKNLFHGFWIFAKSNTSIRKKELEAKHSSWWATCLLSKWKNFLSALLRWLNSCIKIHKGERYA